MRLFTALFLLIVNTVLADMVTLKNGQVTIGSYISEDDKRLNSKFLMKLKPSRNLISKPLNWVIAESLFVINCKANGRRHAGM